MNKGCKDHEIPQRGCMECDAIGAPIRCDGCGNEIDPETCHCGDPICNHDGNYHHLPHPRGCVCRFRNCEEAQRVSDSGFTQFRKWKKETEEGKFADSTCKHSQDVRQAVVVAWQGAWHERRKEIDRQMDELRRERDRSQLTCAEALLAKKDLLRLVDLINEEGPAFHAWNEVSAICEKYSGSLP